jgi:hypothetical protein
VLSFYLDEDCQSAAYVSAIRARGLSVTTVNEQKTNGDSDESQLELAVARGWVMVTRNADDFNRISASWLRAGRTHRGIICIKRAGIGPGALAADLSVISERYATEMANIVEYVPIPAE